MDCLCTFAQRMVGDGCYICNSKLLSRRTGPETSKTAAQNLVKSGAHKSQCDEVYTVLKRFKKNGANANQIAERCGMLPHVVLKRLPDLMKKGLAFKTHTVRDNQTVWKPDC